MVDIKGLDKARVLKALYDRGNTQGKGRFAKTNTTVTLEICKAMVERSCRFDNMFGLLLNVDLSRDDFDESVYDRIYGAGAAKRAVDSVKGAPEDGGDTDKDADDGKKELSLEEKEKLTKDAICKILEILAEIPPEMYAAACIVLKTVLPGPSMGGMAGMLTMTGGPFAPPFPLGWRFG